jgi:hypothetical protein
LEISGCDRHPDGESGAPPHLAPEEAAGPCIAACSIRTWSSAASMEGGAPPTDGAAPLLAALTTAPCRRGWGRVVARAGQQKQDAKRPPVPDSTVAGAPLCRRGSVEDLQMQMHFSLGADGMRREWKLLYTRGKSQFAFCHS